MQTILRDTFGDEKLDGLAVALARKLNIEVDDATQELYLAAIEVQAAYGYVNRNVAAMHTVNAVRRSFNYGINAYYAQEYAETAMELPDADAEDTETAEFADPEATESFSQVDRRLWVSTVMAGLSNAHRQLAELLGAGESLTEAAQSMGITYGVARRLRREIAAALIDG
jgi:DNA-directed RNA polymerase specialized sigma24 family protein